MVPFEYKHVVCKIIEISNFVKKNLVNKNFVINFNGVL